MRTGAYRALLRGAVRAACNYRGDSDAHYSACLRGVQQQPREDWGWWLWFFLTVGPPGQRPPPFDEWMKTVDFGKGKKR